MHEAVETVPLFTKSGKAGRDLFVARHVHFKADVAAELMRKFSNAVTETFAHVGEGEIGAFATARACNAVSNRTVGKNTGNQNFLALQKAHFVVPLSVSIGSAHAQTPSDGELRRLQIIQTLETGDICAVASGDGKERVAATNDVGPFA